MNARQVWQAVLGDLQLRLPRSDYETWFQVTSIAAFDFNPETTRMRLVAMRDGMTRDGVLSEMGFEPEVSDDIETIEPPRPEELEMLRGDIDPDRVIIGHVG